MEVFEGPDFVMTYPCFILMKSDTFPQVITVEGNRALCLFTDSDCLFRFRASLDLRTAPSRRTEIRAAEIHDKKTLLTVLQELEPDLTDNNVEFVALDPTYRCRVVTARLTDFVEMLNRQAK